MRVGKSGNIILTNRIATRSTEPSASTAALSTPDIAALFEEDSVIDKTAAAVDDIF